jgi:twitching motility protein PilJ
MFKRIRLKIWQKLALVGVAFSVPIGVLMYFLVTGQAKDIDFAVNESRGLEYLAPVKKLLRDVQAHRGLANAFLSGDASLKGRLLDAQQAVSNDLEAVGSVDREYGQEYKSSEALAALGQRWAELRAKVASLRPDDSFDLHTKFIKEGIMGLQVHIGNESQLIRDPDVDSHWLMDAVVLKISELTEIMAQARDIGAGAAVRKALSGEERARLTGLMSQGKIILAGMHRDLGYVFSKNKGLESELTPAYQSVTSAADGFFKLIEQRLLSAPTVTVTPTEYFDAGTKAVEAGFTLYDADATTLDKLLQARIERLQQNRLISLVAVALTLGVTILLLVMLVRRISVPIRELSAASEKVSTGDLAVEIPVRSRDEVGQLAATFNQTVAKLRGQVRTETERDEERRKRDELQRNITRFLDTAVEISQGDLTRRGEVTSDILGNVVDAINVMVDEIANVMSDVRKAATQVTSSAGEMIVSTGQMAAGAQAQTREAMSVAAAVEEMTLSVRQVAENAEATAMAAQQALEAAQKGNQAVSNSLAGMQRIRGEVQAVSKKIKSLGDRSLEISGIVNTIEDIASQTNLLALNAAIEAAGAGEAGLRFAVVADEVRKLAERSAKATKDIATLIKGVQTETQEAVVAMEDGTNEVESGYQITIEAGDRLKEIEEVSQKSAELAQDISLATQQQVRGAEGVAAAVQSISSVAVQTEQGVLQTRKTVEDLVRLAEELSSNLARFKLAA